jgi:hypothetical protein
MRAGLRGGEIAPVGFKEQRNLFIMALSEEIGFADRFVREGEVKGRDRKNRKTKRDEKREEDTREMMHAREPRREYRTKTDCADRSSELRQRDGSCDRTQKEASLAQGGEVEIEGDGVAFGGSDLDGGGIGSKGFCEKLELDRGTCEHAATIFGTEVIGLAGGSKGPELAVFAENLNVKIFPKVEGTRGETRRRAGAGARRTRNVGGIGIREKDLNDDFHGFRLAAVIERGLLRAVARAVLTRELGRESERGKESNGSDMWASLGWGEVFGVFVKETGEGFIAALAEEVGFADGLVGKRCVEGE